MQEVIWSIQHFILMIGYGGDGTGISPYFFHEITSFQKLYYDGHLLPDTFMPEVLWRWVYNDDWLKDYVSDQNNFLYYR